LLSPSSFVIWTFWLCVPYECSLCFYYFLHMFVGHGDCCAHACYIFVLCSNNLHALHTAVSHAFLSHTATMASFSHWNNCFVSHNFQRSYNTMDVVFNISSYNGFKQEMQWEIIISLNSCNVFINKQVPQYCHEIFLFHSILF